MVTDLPPDYAPADFIEVRLWKFDMAYRASIGSYLAGGLLS